MSGQMSKEDSARIQSTQEKSGGDMSSSGFASRAQSAADRSANPSGGGAGATASGNNAAAGSGGSGQTTGSGGQAGGAKK